MFNFRALEQTAARKAEFEQRKMEQERPKHIEQREQREPRQEKKDVPPSR